MARGAAAGACHRCSAVPAAGIVATVACSRARRGARRLVTAPLRGRAAAGVPTSARGAVATGRAGGLLRRSLGLGAAILREFVRPPSGPPLRVAAQRSVRFAREVGCVLSGCPPVAAAAAGAVDRRLLGLVGRGFGLGGATGGQQVSLPWSRPPWTAPSEQRRRGSPSRPPGRRRLAPAPAAAPAVRSWHASQVDQRQPSQPSPQGPQQTPRTRRHHGVLCRARTGRPGSSTRVRAWQIIGCVRSAP